MPFVVTMNHVPVADRGEEGPARTVRRPSRQRRPRASASTPIVVPVGGPVADHATGVAALIRDRFAGRTVLVVRHGNTMPAIIRALGITEPVTIADWAYDDMFIVKADAGGRVTFTASKFGVASRAR